MGKSKKIEGLFLLSDFIANRFFYLCFSVVIMVQCYTMVTLVHPTVNRFMMVICGMI